MGHRRGRGCCVVKAGPQGPAAACHVRMGGDGGSCCLPPPPTVSRGEPQESLPLCSKYSWPLETQGNPGQCRAGLVIHGDSGDGGNSYALSMEAMSVLRLPHLCPVARAASRRRLWHRSSPSFQGSVSEVKGPLNLISWGMTPS